MNNFLPAPIYLLENDETKGPIPAEDIEAMLAEEKLTESAISCVEGMPSWRSLKETLVWSYGKTLSPWRNLVANLADELVRCEIDIRYAASELHEKVGRCGDSNFCNVILSANQTLLMKHRQYPEGDNPDFQELWPATELVIYSEQMFPRDWDDAWIRAGGRQGRKMALNNDPVWLKLSDFGFPFPPFSLDLELWVESVSLEDAEAEGLSLPTGPVTFAPIKSYDVVGVL